MSLVNLPTEILRDIISLLIPETFEDVALACRRTYGVCREFLDEYNARCKRFRHFRYTPRPSSAGDDENMDENKTKDEDTVKIHSAVELLQYIAKYPVVARYIVSADLSGDVLGDTFVPIEDEKGQFILGDKSGILRLLQTSSYLAPHQSKKRFTPDFWLGQIDHTLNGHAQVLLLTLLPNVTKLIVPGLMGEWSNSECADGDPDAIAEHGDRESWCVECRQILYDIVDRANAHPHSTTALSRLQRVKSPATDDYDTKCNLSGVAHLLSINSVRSFHGYSFVALEDDYTGVAFHPPRERLGSNLQEVILEHSLLGAMSSQKLFSRIENLRAFRLTWSVKWHGCGMNWGLSQMLQYLQKAAGDTLEELTLHNNGDADDVDPFPATMIGFTRLRVLEIDYDFISGHPYDPAHDDRILVDRLDEFAEDQSNFGSEADDAELSEGAEDAEDAEDIELSEDADVTEDNWVSLDGTSDDSVDGNDEHHQQDESAERSRAALYADFLPHTIERALFHIEHWRLPRQQNPTYLFESMLEQRATKLPNLRDLDIVVSGFQEDGSGDAEARFIALIESFGGTIQHEKWWYPEIVEMKLDN
ncbi:hypothetical protein K4F52_009434 [Lecanicillium sp. MT-2017a]|nr:hypothetical protein K4F52_009434 [Lecanicillium sp. MT-2017a]